MLEHCQSKVGQTVYRVWLETLEPVKLENDEFTIMASSAFKRDFVKEHYNDLLTEASEELIGFRLTFKYTSPDDVAAPTENTTGNAQYTFENFIVGSSNKFAYSAAKAIASKPGGLNESQSTSYNPLFVYGNSGLGKTHLLNAISYEIEKNYPDMRIVYTRGEDFTNEFLSSLQNKMVDEFKEKYRKIDVLFVDDVQFIAGKISVQEELFHTIDALIISGKQVVLSSDRPPKEIKTLEERLCSRFEWGIIADLQSPDLETRIAIIKGKAEAMNFEISDDVVEYIAEKIKSNVRQLEGIVKKLHAKYDIEKQPPTLMLAQSVIKDILTETEPSPITIKKVVEEVSRTFSVNVEDIYSKNRKGPINTARKVSLYIIREVTGLPFEVIGEEFNKHHSTIMYAVDQVAQEIATNKKLGATINDIIKNVKQN